MKMNMARRGVKCWIVNGAPDSSGLRQRLKKSAEKSKSLSDACNAELSTVDNSSLRCRPQ